MTGRSRQEPIILHRSGKSELELKASVDGLDPRLIELVRLLARRAARKAYREMLEERSTPRS